MSQRRREFAGSLLRQLLDQCLFTLEPERYDAFVQALDNPPAPGPKLKALLKRTPAWEA